MPQRPPYRELSGTGSEAQQAAEAEELARAWSSSVIDDLFGGLLHSRMRCSVCGAESHAFDPFLDLSLALPEVHGDDGAVSIEDCLSTFCAPEVMAGSEQLSCAHCRCRQDGSKALRVFRYPRLLVLQLKRFGGMAHGRGFRAMSKATTPLRLRGDADLDLRPYCSPAGLAATTAAGLPVPRYELAAVLQHSGCLGGGHYTALARAASGSWFGYDDDVVTSLRGPPAGKSSAPYVLFFRLHDVRCPDSLSVG